LLETLEGLRVGRGDIWIDLHIGHLLASLDHVGKCRFLEIRRALNGANQIGNEISAALVNILNVCPASIDLLLQAYQPVVSSTATDKNNHNQDCEDR
jgi:hypothetical protein